MSETLEAPVGQETWEIQVPGGVNVWKRNRRTGEYEHARVHGTKGPRILHIDADDRLYNQELVQGAENGHLDPFANGSLAQIVKGGEKQGLTEERLIEYFEIEEEDAFRELIGDIEAELTIRRLRSLAETHGRMMHVQALSDLIEDKFKLGGTQPTVAEMMAEGDSKGETVG